MDAASVAPWCSRIAHRAPLAKRRRVVYSSDCLRRGKRRRLRHCSCGDGGHTGLIPVRLESTNQAAAPSATPGTSRTGRHPFAVDPGTSEESRFRPVPEPSSDGRNAWFDVQIESREHFTWALEQAKRYVLEVNDWRYSIRN